MSELSERQKQLLKAIIELYVKTGEPVASELIEKAYSLGVSPATIRNEMVRLTDLGFLKQLHVSGGRAPTSMGFRLYINELMKERELPVVDEVTLRQQLLDTRREYNHMLQTATRALAKKCGTLAVSVNGQDVYYTGAANILDLPEFYDIDVTRFVLSMLDELSVLERLISLAQGPEPVHVIFGEDTGFEHLLPTSFAFTDFDNGLNEKGVIGIIGPCRLNFPLVIPYLRYVGSILSEAGRM
ncbi:MAG: hypothetical protein Q7S44_02920 [bacterium]|nr:hypothetical protein [bacterium]